MGDDVSVVVVTWNSLPYIERCLASIRRRSSPSSSPTRS
jgi:GT2 family glycosyltransferase